MVCFCVTNTTMIFILSLQVNFAQSRIFYQQNHPVWTLLCRVFFTQHNVFEIPPRGVSYNMLLLCCYFLLLSIVPLFGYTTVYLFIHLFTGIWIAASQAIMIRAAMDICVQVFVWAQFSFLLSKYVGVEFAICIFSLVKCVFMSFAIF